MKNYHTSENGSSIDAQAEKRKQKQQKHNWVLFVAHAAAGATDPSVRPSILASVPIRLRVHS